MHQAVAYEPTPQEVDVHGRYTKTECGRYVRLLGTARSRGNGLYTCLAHVESSLCWVEVRLHFEVKHG